jgi:crotonobetainyl-CoA:carnitine CoA-transferase CaiB-like acyl-CoA transferase
MKPLAAQRVLAIGAAAESGLARFLVSLGAEIEVLPPEQLAGEVAGASFLIERMGLAALEPVGCTRALLERLNPALIHVSVTAFGNLGEHRGWRGSELLASAMGGTLGLTGEPDRAPVKEALDACYFHADMVAAAGAMAAHYERGQSGLGQLIDVSVQQVAFSRNVNSILVWQFDRRKLHRVSGALNYGRATVRCIWPLADGWCFHTLMTGRFGAPANQALSDWIDECGLDNPLRGTDWVRYNRSTLDAGIRATWEAAIAAFFRTRRKQEIASEGRRRGINACVIAEPADVLADPHLAARAFWASEGGIRRPGRFLQFAEAAAPMIPQRPASGGRPGPLSGVRVLDFSWALVGSITTKTLGDLGAQVIKVESRTRPCLTRIDVQVSASTANSFDDKPWYAHLNSSKQSLALDMKKPESREVLEPLIRWADVVVENFSPGTMAKLGLDYEQLRQRNPSLIMVSGSVYGQSGPLAQEWGVDGTGAALSGRTFLTGWPDRDPVIPGAVPYGDVIVPYVMAAGIAAALEHRRTTGRGCHIDASMYEICVQQTYAAIVQAQTGPPPCRVGNAEPGMFSQGVYPAAGKDCWIAISCATIVEWQQLRRFAGLAEAATAEDRDALIAAWSENQDGRTLVNSLQQAGIGAGLVQDIEALLEHDSTLAERGALIMLDHPQLGGFAHVATPVRFSRSTLAPYRAPGLGEHSLSVAREQAGLSAERIGVLETLGVFQ